MKQVNLRIYQTVLPLLMGLFLSVGAYAQTISVRGHVKDAMGGVIGANVVEKGNTANGTITDLDGNFTMTVPQGATLVVSFIGYKTVEVAAAPSVTVTLQDDSELLNEVVVIGYGRARKSDMTGAVTAIKPDEINKGLQVSAQDMIQGKIAGVNVQNSGGEPGGGSSIRIRGGSSLNASNDPLIVIDGLAMDNYGMQGMSNPLNLVNPADIESFTVLKDASATAIYGSRASNGVIIITTKKGRKGMKPTVTYNGNVSFSKVVNKLDVLNASEYMDYIQQKTGLSDEEWLASDYYATMGYYSAYNADGTPVVREKIAGNAYEASCVYKKGKYYYLFASIGSCCEGANSTYQTVVGRSTSLLGPYVNKKGERMLDNKHEIVISGNEHWAGPGHNSIVIRDDAKQEWIVYHGYPRAEADKGRVVLLDRLQWTKDGWPYVEGTAPSKKAAAPIIKQKKRR